MSRRAVLGGAAAGSVAAAAVMVESLWPQTTQAAPPDSFLFALDFGTGPSSFFTEVSGIGSENEIVEQKVVDDSGREIVRKIPGRLKWQDVVLKRGVDPNLDLADWRKMVEDGNVSKARKNGALLLFDTRGNAVAKWNFQNAWPSKVDYSALGGPDTMAIETIILTHEAIVRSQ